MDEIVQSGDVDNKDYDVATFFLSEKISQFHFTFYGKGI